MELTAQVVRTVREKTALSQRAFGEAVGTSGPTVARYESGAMEPRLSTLQRMAAEAGLEVNVRLLPRDPSERRRRRRELQQIAVAAAVAAAVKQDYPRARRAALARLDRFESNRLSARARGWVTEWRRAILAGPDAVSRVLLDPSDHGHDMRQMTPFAGLITEAEAAAARRAANAIVELELVP